MSRFRYLALVLFPVVTLLAGIVLGGRHPDALPGFLRNPLVGDKQTKVLREALDDVHSTYYRKISDKDLANAGVDGIVASPVGRPGGGSPHGGRRAHGPGGGTRRWCVRV